VCFICGTLPTGTLIVCIPNLFPPKERHVGLLRFDDDHDHICYRFAQVRIFGGKSNVFKSLQYSLPVYNSRMENSRLYSTCYLKHHSIYDLMVFSSNTSRIIENFQSSSCIIYENLRNCSANYVLCFSNQISTLSLQMYCGLHFQFRRTHYHPVLFRIK
jgi:hypothetical protein